MKLPDGFAPVYTYSYRNGKTIKQRKPDEVRLDDLRFANGIPALPLRFVGELWFKGWEYQQDYVIDAKKVLWCNQIGTNGFSLIKTDPEVFLIQAGDEENYKKAYESLIKHGVKVAKKDYKEYLIKLSKNFDKEHCYLKEAAYALATWLFDGNSRKKLKKIVPSELYVLTLEYYLDGNHDT